MDVREKVEKPTFMDSDIVNTGIIGKTRQRPSIDDSTQYIDLAKPKSGAPLFCLFVCLFVCLLSGTFAKISLSNAQKALALLYLASSESPRRQI